MFPILTFALLSVAAPPDGPIVVAQIARGQELVYRGKCEVTGRGPTSSTRRQCTVGFRTFVLSTADDQAEVAFFTTLSDASRPNTTSVRLMLADVDYLGRLKSMNDQFAVPLDGAAPLESAAFVELPGKPLAVGDHWEVNEAGRPPRTWTVAAVENPAGGARCLKLIGEQATLGWGELGTSCTWHRQDTVWLDMRTGLARRVERVIDLRDPSRREVTSKVVTRLDLESNITYPDRLDAERRAEIMMAWQTERGAANHATAPRSLDLLERRVNYHVNNLPTTAYREAVLAAARKIDAARRGEVQLTSTTTTTPIAIAVGQTVSDFVANDLSTGVPTRLGRQAERPSVLVFFRPESPLAFHALKAVADLGSRASVAGLCVTDGASTALQLTCENRLAVPLYDGREVQARYLEGATPRFVVLDSDGVVRLVIDGYGSEVASLLLKAVESEGCTR